MPDYVTIKLHIDTRRLLRLIAAQSGEQMVQVMQRLCENEWSRISQNPNLAHEIAHNDDLRGTESEAKPH